MEKTCFIIMPIGTQKYGDIEVSAQELKDKYADLISEAIRSANPSLKIIRADEIPDQGIITDQIIELLTKCRYVVADITYPNPNVYYELGVRHASRPGTILIKEKSNAQAPFDIAHLRHIEYENTPTGLKKLSNELKKKFAWYEKNPEKYDNTVLTYSNHLNEHGKTPEYYTIEARKRPYDHQGGDWAGLEYRIINLFGEEFVLFKSEFPNKLAKLVIDDKTKYTLKTGEILDLGEGYGLEIKQVDAKGDKVWAEFTKDGEYIEDKIIDLEKCLSTWTLKLDNIEEEENITVLKVQFLSVFKGDVDAIVQIQGLWLIDYEKAFTIEKGDIFGKFEVYEIGSSYLKFKVNET